MHSLVFSHFPPACSTAFQPPTTCLLWGMYFLPFYSAQKIRSLDAMAKLSKEISGMLKKDFVHLSLEKKESKELRANLDGYGKTVSFTILVVFTKFSLLNLE